MKPLTELYKIGVGPSSSHTMGPCDAAQIFLERNVCDSRFVVTLYGSLAATGKGHMTDRAIKEVLSPHSPVEIIWKPDVFLDYHPNRMKFQAYDKKGKLLDDWLVFSVGGGAISVPGMDCASSSDVYDLTTMADIYKWCKNNGLSYWVYVNICEGDGIWDYLRKVWEVMKAAVEHGLETEGVLSGSLHLQRKSSYIKAMGYKDFLKSRGLIFSYALAVSEENVSGSLIVTAPTCCSCGVLPAVLYHLWKSRNFSEGRILKALATAGLFGNVVKHNAFISGAEVGCQGEVGVAYAMASAAACHLFGGSLSQIEYAAEMGLEHHLGMMCDPVCGLVQIPCIERNAHAAARAFDANMYSFFLTDCIPFHSTRL